MNETYPPYYGSADLFPESRKRSLRSIIPFRLWLLVPVLYFSLHGNVPILQSGGGGNDAITGTGVSGMAAAAGMAVVAGMSFLCVAIMQPSYKAILTSLLRTPLVAFLPAWAVLSAAWSQEPTITLRKAILLTLSTLFAVYLAKGLSPRDLARLLMLVGVVAAISSILFCAALPSYGIDHVGQNTGSWQGIYPQKNSFGMGLMYLLTPAFLPTEATGVRRSHRLMYGLLLLLLIGLSQSRTAWGMALLYMGLMIALRIVGRFPRQQAVLLLTVAVALTAVAGWAVSSQIGQLMPLLGRDSTLSGRTIIWGAAVQSALKQPIVGYGYEAFWLGNEGEAVNVLLAVHLSLTHAHNGLINLWLELGAVGVAGFAFLFLAAIKNSLVAFHARRTPFLDWYVGLIFLTVAYNIDESFLVRSMDLQWMLFLVGCVGLAEVARTTSAAVRQARLVTV